jgi:hypothetical protein
MADDQVKLDQYLERLPPPNEIRDRLCRNFREAKLLRQLLKLSEQRQRVREVSPCGR